MTQTAPRPILPQAVSTPRLRARADDRAPTRHYALLIALLAILAAIMIYPLISGIAAAFFDRGHLSAFWIESALQNATFRRQLLTSLALGVVVTILCNLISFPLALIGRAYDFRGKKLFASLVLVPMVLPPFVGAIGMKQLLGTFGSFTVALQNLGLLAHKDGIDWLGKGGFWVLASLITLGVYPIAYLNLQASLANIDPAMLEAAQNLGGRRWTNFWRITLPLAMPGVFAGSTLIFIWAFTELGTPLLMSYPHVVSRSIWDDVAQAIGGENSLGYAKVFVVLLISTAVYLVGKVTLGRSGFAMTSKAAVAQTTRRLSFGKGLLAASPFAIITALALLPHIGVLLYSVTAIATEKAAGWGPANTFGWYRTVIPNRYTLAGYQAVFNTPEIYGAILNSIKYAATATAINIVLGVAIAWVLVRTRVAGRLALDSLAMLPLAVPGLVMAFGFVATVPQLAGGLTHLLWPLGLHAGLNTPAEMKDWLGKYLIQSPFLLLVVAYTVRRMPYLVRSAAGGLQQTSVTLEEAAANLGAAPWRVMVKITLPLIMANLIAGSVLTFAFSMLEVSDSLILAQSPAAFPITKMIYVLGNDTSGPENVRNACALGVVAMLFLIAAIVSASMIMGKRLGAVFRA
ncbi:MAG TPA: iron ABC transporter permease [Phycisphaerae bacterium]|nr:iron ABC transporter permease [Phycisphaerae bacterium]